MKYDLEADYVIVGAGSAGCVLANRLSADGKYKVILIEAGGDDRVFHELRQFYTNLNIHIPAGFTRNYLEKGLNWNYMSEPEPGLNGRRLAVPRGRVLGGSSSINGMIYARGLDSDFDGWRQAGCVGWAFEDVLPFFRKSEDFQGGASRRHGVGGPLPVGYAPFRFPVGQAIIDAVAEMTGKRTDDINGENQEGLTFSPVTARNGLRRSSSVAFLHPALKRPNLSVEKRALTEAVLFEGKKATGIRFSRGGRTYHVRAHREVIISGGAINSPQLLQLSGIGPADLLTEHGVAVLHDSPSVGNNLQDHLAVTASVRLKPGTLTANQLTRGPALVGQIMKYAFRRTGLLTTGGAMVTGYARSRRDLDLPDIQLFFAPATVDVAKLAATSRMVMEIEPGLTLSAYKTRPASRGHVRIRSADPREAPAVLHNYLADPSDRRTAVDSLRFLREVFSQPSLAQHIDHIMRPGDEVQSDEELLDFARAAGSSAFHEAGSVAMGDRPESPLDPRLRVNGVTGLRVADASVMPLVTSGNTNAGTLMIAEKAADMILADVGQT